MCPHGQPVCPTRWAPTAVARQLHLLTVCCCGTARRLPAVLYVAKGDMKVTALAEDSPKLAKQITEFITSFAGEVSERARSGSILSWVCGACRACGLSRR